jgi:hypothetical protein
MLEKCALSIKKYADSKRAKIIQDEALQYAEDDEAADDLEELLSPDLLTQADILEKYFGIEYDSKSSSLLSSDFSLEIVLITCCVLCSTQWQISGERETNGRDSSLLQCSEVYILPPVQ